MITITGVHDQELAKRSELTCKNHPTIGRRRYLTARSRFKYHATCAFAVLRSFGECENATALGREMQLPPHLSERNGRSKAAGI